MSINITLSAEVSAWLQRKSDLEGVSPSLLAERVLNAAATEDGDPAETEDDFLEAIDRRRAAKGLRRLFPEDKRGLTWE